MIKNECEIVKDLIPNYVENVISKATKEFVETHINSCNNCKKILEELKKEKNAEKTRMTKQEDYEIDYLKKYNKKITLLKIIAGTLMVIILAIWAFAFAKYIEYRKDYKIGEYNYSIIEQAYNKIKEIKNSKNYIYIESWQRTNCPEYKSISYYKDGKFKEENYNGDGTISYINYGVDISENDYYFVQYNEHSTEAVIGTGYRNLSREMPSSLSGFYDLGITECASLEVYEDNELYVLRKAIDEYQYDELWIDKQTMIPIKSITKDFNIRTDFKYTYKEGEVKDSDVELDESKFEDKEWKNDYGQRIKEEILSRY